MLITRQVQLFKQTDKIVKAYLTLLLKRFRKIQRSLPFDELNIMNTVNQQWADMDNLMRECLYKVAIYYYKAAVKTCKKDYDDQEIAMWYAGLLDDYGIERWCGEVLDGFDPVTHYSYFPESDRKRARMIEAILSVKSMQDRKKQLDIATKYLARQLEQTADDITIDAVKKGFQDAGVEKVEWISQRDDRVCEDCESLDGKIFTWEDLPPLPQHYNCRCFIAPVL